MDINVLRTILRSSDNVWRYVESSDEWKIVEKENRFPVTDNVVLNSVTSSLTNLLSYKVSREFSQRFTVRLHIIEILREWCRAKGSLSKLNGPLRDNAKTWKLIIQILKKHLTDDLINNANSADYLLQLFHALRYLLPENLILSEYLYKIISRITEFDLIEGTERLLTDISESEKDLKVDSILLMKIYSYQRVKFIEEPITDAFVLFCTSEMKSAIDRTFLSGKLDKLLERVVNSPIIFRRVSSFLKEMFIAANYAPVALNFIQFLLGCITNRCKNTGKDIIDLYPLYVQACVILMRIKPIYHSRKSKLYTEKLMKDIFLRNTDDALILLSHFPFWLDIFSSFLVTSILQQNNSLIID